VYRRSARLCIQDNRPWLADDSSPYRFTTLLLRALADDRQATCDTATRVIHLIVQGFQWPMAPIADEIVRCGLAYLGREEPTDEAHRMLFWVISQLDLGLVTPALRERYEAQLGRLGPPIRPQWTVGELEA